MLARHFVSYVATLAAFLAIDLVWLGVLAKEYYSDAFEAAGVFLDVDLKIAAGFYALYILGVVVFAVSPALDRRSFGHALLFGALFGLFAYATYDLTNLATISAWPLIISVVDIAWGTVLTAVSAAIGYAAARLLVRA